MGKFYNTKIWLEDRESDILEKYDFTEEICETEIEEGKRWILDDLKSKGFLTSFTHEDKEYYHQAGGYLQHFN